jgi:class 3 adenylate cyclase
MSLAAPGEVLVSRALRDVVAGSDIELADRGISRLKGVPGEFQLYAASVQRFP